MKPPTIVLMLLGLASVAAPAAWGQKPADVTAVAAEPGTIITRGAALVAAKRAHGAGDRDVGNAVAKILRQAKEQLTRPDVAVTDKRSLLPPSGNPHDYFSLSPYWWPDSSKRDGLPYIRRDGITNPESKRDLDQPRVALLADRVQLLALAWWFSGDGRYSDAAVRQVRTWFVDSATRMTPHLRYAQLVRGIDAERGSGIIDSRGFVEVVDAIGILRLSPTWTPADEQALREWFRAYLTWLTDSPNGRAEHAAKNNHGSWYAAQVASYALFVGDTALVRRMATESMARIGRQFQPNGRQPEEFARTRSMHYSNFNIEALSRVAEVGLRVGVDLWSYRTPEGSSLTEGLRFMAPYVDRSDAWPGEQIDPVNRLELLRAFRRAAIATGDPVLHAAARQLSSGSLAADRPTVLFHPPVRQ